MSAPLLSIGAVASAHGVRGQFKVKPFTAMPRDIASYGPVWVGDRQLTLVIRGMTANGLVIVAAEGIASREAAEALRGNELLVDRTALPEAGADEVYHTDLIGLAAVTAGGAVLGSVVGLHDFGAGELIEIRPPKGPTVMLPFEGEHIADIDVDGGRVVLNPPDGFLETDERADRG